MSDNQKITKEEATAIRQLEDFDLVMLISEVNDNGWDRARETLRMMPTQSVFKSEDGSNGMRNPHESAQKARASGDYIG